MSNFFIRRPIVAMVIAILTVIVGVVMTVTLPVAQFPNIAPPEIRLSATYVGADANALEQAVATPIEQQINGVDNLDYMYSVNATGGSTMNLFSDFKLGTDPNMDLILTQSREQLATGQLPPEVNNFGITAKKATTAPMMLVAVYSPHGSRDATFLANYAYINLNDPVARSYGVGQTQVFGAGQYAMRMWVKPDQLAKLNITVTDIVNAIQAQNTVNPAGQVGGEPAAGNQQFTYAVLAQGRLKSPEEFGNVVVREAPNGGTVRVRDVARVELGAQTYSLLGRFNGKPSAILAIYQLPGTNAVQAVDGVRKLMAQLKQRFPDDVDYAVSLDQTRAVTAGMKEIVETLVIAIVLVLFVVYLFLQDWRATLIPMLAVPVSLIGTFTLFPICGFSINTLSLLGLVLAIGLVVDDAIVVVEGVQRHIEEGLAPKDAARKAMEELSGPVVGIALVLASVFVPTAFIPGITGRLYQQFALTIAISVILSAFNALTLSPALAGLLLRPAPAEDSKRRGPLGKFFGVFNRYWERATEGFVRWSDVVIRKGALVLALLVVCGLGAFFFAGRLPSSFLPDEDYGGSTNGYGGSSNGYGGSSNGYGGSSNGYGGSSNGYGGSSSGYGGSSNGYGGSSNGYGGSSNGSGGSSNGYGGSTNGYGGSTNGYGGTPGSGGVIDIQAGTTYQLESAPTDYTLIEGSGTLDLNGQFADATVTLQGFTGTIINSSSNVATFAASIEGGNFSIAGSNNISIIGTLDGASITMNGTSELVFNTGPSSLAALTINSGEVQMQSTLNVAGGTLTVNGGEIDLCGRDAIVGSLAGTGGAIVNSYVTLASTVNVTNANGDSYQGVRQGDINWEESGISFYAGSPNGPQITNFTVERGPDFWTLTGDVSDPNQNPQGMTVVFGSVLDGQTAIVDADDQFMLGVEISSGITGTVCVQTVDSLDLASNIAWEFID